MSAVYSFLPWVRQGAVTSIRTEDTLDEGVTPHADLALRLQLNTSDEVDVDLRMYGPADVIGMEGRQIVRTDPPGGTGNFPPSFFPTVEFNRPDFPWLFTPARAETRRGRLRPWLCLVVVRKGDGVSLRPPAGGPLPVLEIEPPAVAADELPDLSESWAWVHAQVVHGEDDNPGQVLTAAPTRNISRLMCPRRLAPHASYYACLVPTFDVGRRAGLGLSITDEHMEALHPAWGSGDNAPIEIRLPVYFHWSFSTGQEGDFEAVVRRLKAAELPEDTGALRLFLGDAGVPSLPDLGTFDFAGVFRPPLFEAPILPDDLDGDREAWVEQMTQWLNRPDDGARGETSDAVVTPPIYAQYQQAIRRVPEAAGWVRDLNLDARNRAAAGLGVLFVQWYQEDLMASAWDQLGDLKQARQLIRQNELAREVGRATLSKRFATAAEHGELLYQMTAAGHARVRLDKNQTIAGWARANGRPQPATTATFRRVSRSNGPVARRMRVRERSAVGPVALRRAETGDTTPGALETTVAPASTRVQELERQKDQWLDGASDREAAGRMAPAVDELTTYLNKLSSRGVPAAGPVEPASSFVQNETLLEKLNPGTAMRRRLKTQLHLNGTQRSGTERSRAAGDGVPAATDVMGYPEFPQPMFEAVRDLMPELLLAGAEDLPADSVTVLETNPQFIEAFMVGLNHEMARELLWRGFPTDLQGTYFKYFWGATAEVNRDRAPDVPDVHHWDPKRRLGDNLTSGNAAGQLALVIRGELLRRFPDTVIYAVSVTPEGGLGTDEKYPVQRGVLRDDAVFLLFDLTEAEAIGGEDGDGGDGYFFVLQQQPSEPRFGLDELAETETPSSWNQLAWAHVATDPGGYLRVEESSGAVSAVNEPDGPAWGFNGAHMADILLQRPFRVAIHARTVI